MPEQEIKKVKTIKSPKINTPPLAYSRRELIIFIAITAFLIVVNAVLGIILVRAASQTFGGSWAKTILLVGIGIIVFFFLLFSGLIVLFFRKSLRGIWIVWAFLFAFVIIGGSILLGTKSGLNLRMQADQQFRFTKAAEHFNYGIQALNQGDLVAAKTQFLYVNELFPSFPGLVEKLTEVELKLALALTPVATPTPEPMAIPTGGTPDDYFNLAQQAIQGGDWASALGFLEAIRNINLDYRQIELDSAYYFVLRNLGLAQINTNNLENGVYNLTLAQKFAPLDSEAARSMSWAKANIERNVWISFASEFITIGNNLSRSNQPACDVLHEYQTARNILDQHGVTEGITIWGDKEDLNTKINYWYVICYPPTPTPTLEPTRTATIPVVIIETSTETPTTSP
jgi:hypothetical protein